ARADLARASFRHNRPETDDHRHLRIGRGLACPDWMAFSRGNADRGNANAGVDGDIFRGLRGGEFGLFDGERNFSAGDSSAGNRNFLCDRDARRRGWRTGVVWMDHRHGLDYCFVHRISRRRGADDPWRSGRGLDWRAGRTAITRAYCRATLEPRIVAAAPWGGSLFPAAHSQLARMNGTSGRKFARIK